jgi:hypothetical protein
MDATLDEIERGEKISAELAKTQRRLDDTKQEYLAYANGITGNCPASLGVLLSSPDTSSLPSAAGTPVDPTATVDAAAIGTNIAENRWRFEVNYATCAALVGWHAGQKKDLTQ